MPDLSLEKKLGGIVAGIDEAGRGPWAGPVVAAAVIIIPDNVPDGLQDSKKLSKKKRETVFRDIQKYCKVGIGIIDEKVIDQVNILEATKLAMIKALKDLGNIPDFAIVDGNQLPQFPCPSHAIIGGDGKSSSIAAASIIAKVTRDRIMESLHEIFPQYGWNRNAGYGTKEHHDNLIKFGPTPHHRTSFAPIRAIINSGKKYG